MTTLYLLAGCNGAGKTTAAYALLPGLLDCREFELLAPAPYF
ncbi:hypothetical protein Q5H93_17635 [Hymenobacter sp. ASUV-10]|uniref:UDP-N-acetylglucosamine kinase n=1 Tax=Hymenobacter aranciens TaxID=3063996 RepID=A0ABT9BE74_9BACT|nr:hypothetical protein [Hymenobacter sp. ASUV-10]MDO7876571.1 hypothetical protein [Hymenobacter sp. ASUV-10]